MCGAILLVVIGWTINGVVENAVKQQLSSSLQTILDTDLEAITVWLESQEAIASAIANDDSVSGPVAKLVTLHQDGKLGVEKAEAVQVLRQLREELEPHLLAHRYDGFVVLNPAGTVLATPAEHSQLLGSSLPVQDGLLALMREKGTLVTRPTKSLVALPGENNQKRAGMPTMFTFAPIVENERVIASIGLRINPKLDFTRILSVARAGKSGETYAFDSEGVLLSQSRFDDQLKEIGLLTDDPESQSILNIAVRDPEVDMTQGQRPSKRRDERDFTVAAKSAIAGQRAFNVDGYPDYRGVAVVGAWTWLKKYGFGVSSEADVAEAYQPLYVLRYAFGGLFALLVGSAIGLVTFSVVMAKVKRKAARATLKAEQLGQYRLDEKIGEGGMGVVYRGHHAMLRRPTAIKLLHPEKTSDEAVARFEREVKLTSQLNHPNTVAVFDYGRTPDGIFYYAMEFLDGLALSDLVLKYGPQPDGRVGYILQQVCGSLLEAHGVNLIHRDIKPANIILNRRGGQADVVKLVDFGLVKAIDGRMQTQVTNANAVIGTPHYMSPEAVERPNSIDSRSDLYALAAVGYFLLSGETMFEGESIVDVCVKQVREVPDPPSSRTRGEISQELEAILMKCLAKSPDDRPASARVLLEQLEQVTYVQPWTREDAEDWWNTRTSMSDLGNTTNVHQHTTVHHSEEQDL